MLRRIRTSSSSRSSSSSSSSSISSNIWDSTWIARRLLSTAATSNVSRSIAYLIQDRHFSSSAPSAPELPDSTIQKEYASEVKDVLGEYEERQKRRQSLIGTIVSTKNTKTISVQVMREKFFPKYNKSMSARKKIMAHDEKELGSLGDLVRIVPCRPMSKMKRHELSDVIRAAEV